MSRTLGRSLAGGALALLSITAYAQFPGIRLPAASPAASISQDLGSTSIEVSYARPAINGRKVWGDLVPYNDVWRAGADANTTVTFHSDVTVQGQPLPAGTYGLHMMPTEGPWTVIFSKQNKAWGSFSYDQKHDALRVAVTPETKSEAVERLSYSFDDVTDDAATLAMRWEKLRVPVQIKIDLPRLVLADIRDQLTGVARFGSQGWAQAATYAARNGGDLAEAQSWAEKAVSMQRNFNTLRALAAVHEKKGDAASAATLRADAMNIATEQERNAFGYQLLAQRKYDEAIDVFKRNVVAFPASVNTHDSLAEAYATKGDRKLAAASYSKALTLAKRDEDRTRINKALEKLK